MSEVSGVVFLSFLLVCVFVAGLISSHAAYRNGVRDGYGYACEPWNPGYAPAARIIREDRK